MPIAITRDGAAAVVRLTGSVTIRHAAELHEALQRELHAGCEELLVEPAGLERTDSSILQLLASAANSGLRVKLGAGETLANAIERFGMRRKFAGMAR